VEAQELERKRLARELHDETGQVLTSVLLGLKAAESAPEHERTAALRGVRSQVAAAAQDVRRLAVELRPAALDDFGLVPAVQHLARTFRENTGVSVDVETRIDAERLPGETETALYRIIQEALTNVTKHAEATRVSIFLTEKEHSVVAIVEDDGHGFDTAARREGLGLLGMQERLRLLDGRLTVESSENGGTTLVAEVPLA
jgi:signal transduction histidine kinase